MTDKKIKSTLPKLKGKTHRITVHSYNDALVSYDHKNKVRSLEIKGIPQNHNSFNQIKLEVDKTLYLFNSKKV